MPLSSRQGKYLKFSDGFYQIIGLVATNLEFEKGDVDSDAKYIRYFEITGSFVFS